MNKHLIALTGALLITGTSSVFAASTVDLTVKGIITPNACNPTLSSGGVIDHGKISAKDLNTDKITLLPPQTLQMIVTCDAATPFALKATDNRRESGTGIYFGLGTNNGKSLGGYSLNMVAPVADDEAVQAIASFDGGTTWERYNSFEDQLMLSVSTVGDTTPRPTEELITDIKYQGFISRTDGLDLSEEVNIDGSATIEVIYL